MNISSDSGARLKAILELDKTSLPHDGGDAYNRLVFSSSPYLLQHAENPVDWYEWGDAAFAKARSEQRPILLSIGYATCHWCHVMAHECFEDKEVAEQLNLNYVCIKVDREERPDIDDYYMSVSQLLTGSGGWPLNIFMTPEKEAFFAMTYLPKRGRGGTGGFLEVLSRIRAFWEQKPNDIRQSCRRIMDVMETLVKEPGDGSVDLPELESLAFDQLASVYDKEWGGFGTAPKFPMPINLSWLIRQGLAGNDQALEMALHSLDKMRSGGIWDQLAGGVHRYAVDRDWLTPHFEKMLYDQAMLSMTVLEAFQASGDDKYLEVADTVFCFVENELTSPEGVFYSALDADSEGAEGRFYVWLKQELDELLGPDADLFCRFYAVSGDGNFEGMSILHNPLDLVPFCLGEGKDVAAVQLLLEGCRERVLDHRNRRVRPLRDEKIITAWNGLMIASLAKAGAVSGVRLYIEQAESAARFILENLHRPDGRLLRSSLGGKPSHIPAFLEDYAFLCHGLLELYEATLDDFWLNEALRLADESVRLFRNRESGQFAKSGSDSEQMPGRTPLDHDGVIPSPFSLLANCFVRLWYVLEREDLHGFAQTLLAPALADARLNPSAHLGALMAFGLLENEPTRVVFRGDPGHVDMFEFLQMVKSSPVPNLVIVHESGATRSPSVSICSAGKCYPPAKDRCSLEAILKELK